MSEEDINMAAEKFDESKHLAENAMANVLENDVSTEETIVQLRDELSVNIVKWAES